MIYGAPDDKLGTSMGSAPRVSIKKWEDVPIDSVGCDTGHHAEGDHQSHDETDLVQRTKNEQKTNSVTGGRSCDGRIYGMLVERNIDTG